MLLTLLVTAVLVQLSCFSTTIYLHRSLAHRALRLHPAVAFLMHLELWLVVGISPRQWVAVHRKHHRYSDQEGDPHSPYHKGLWRVLLYNHVYYWRECQNVQTITQFGKDIRASILDRLPLSQYLGPAMGLAALSALLGIGPGVTAFGLHAATYVLLNAAINGAAHVIGYRNFDNTATNIRPLALITAGEGLHNNHHEFPVSAKFSHRRGEFDPAWPMIRLLTAFHLATVSPSIRR